MGKVEGTNSAKTRTKTRKSNVKQECKCKFHDEFSTMYSDSDKRLYNTSSHDIKNIGHLHLLIEHGYLTKKSSNVWSGCLACAGKNLDKCKGKDTISNDSSLEEDVLSVSDIPNMSFKHCKEVQIVAEMKQSGTMPEESLIVLCKTIVKSLNKNVYKGTCDLQGEYKNLEKLISSECETFMANRPKALVEVLRELTWFFIQRFKKK